MELAQNLAKYDGPKNGHGAFLVGEELSAGDIMVAFSAECVLHSDNPSSKGADELWDKKKVHPRQPAFRAQTSVAEHRGVVAGTRGEAGVPGDVEGGEV